MKTNIFGFSIEIKKAELGSTVRWSETKKRWISLKEMHPYHLVNTLRKELPDISNQRLFGEAHEYYSELFSRMAEYTKEQEVL